MYRIENGSTPVLVFVLVDATDDETAETGLSPTVNISKNGDAFAATTNSASEISNGFYKVTLTATETNTDGPLAVYASATGTNIFRAIYNVETLPEQTLTDAEHNVIADHVLKRSFGDADGSSDGDGGTSPAYRSLMGVVAKQTNKTAMSGTTLTIYEEDDTTAFFTQTATTSASADPVTALDTN